MLTLDEHNKLERERCFQKEKFKYHAGILCPNPDCDEELMYRDPGMILMSYPAEMSVYCPKCNYKGYKVV